MRWKIHTKDRVGMVLDVLNIFNIHEVNIQAMEVLPKEIFIKFDTQPRQDKLKKELEADRDIEFIEEITVLPIEKKERQLSETIEAVSEGIMSIDQQGRVNGLNQAAQNILNLSGENSLGKHVSKVLNKDVPMLRTLRTGKGYENKEMILNINNSQVHYITTGKPIKDDYGNTMGVVATMQDMRQVRQLVYSLTKPNDITFDQIVFNSEKMTQRVELAKLSARSEATVLIQGESGTGKELFARAIHNYSERNKQPFVPINCAALPHALLESELFGYQGGAFTGARKEGKQGLFEFAKGGTVFLDEIGDMPMHIQVKILRVLQEKTIRRIGSNHEIPIDVRVITATNKPLQELVNNNKFREDLYYRINVIPINIPPLRERAEDITILAEYFLDKYQTVMDKHVGTFSEKARQSLFSYYWPGNVRELENVIERAVILTPINEDIDVYALNLEQKLSEETDDGKTLKEKTDAFEKKLLLEAAKKHQTTRKIGNALGISHTAVRKKLKKHRVETIVYKNGN
ncbi:sigma 54-interacting transcriptional regulator [Proteinivorax hydrogeniformans]|uniref:HTH-type transcriptional regulatory protein TyrR n=1 Tax=Proteinivorax hydrogeniformans TaxID=1826727 RepID=A0AAU8HW13_9FIRM